MKNILSFLFVTVLTSVMCMTAFALPLNRQFQDIKLPTQAMLERQTFTDLAAADTTGVLNAHAGPTSAAALTISSGFTQPDQPRNFVITPAGTTADVKGCTVVVTGKNIFNRTITENFVIADNQNSATTGTKAFKSITSVAFPADCEEGGFDATWSIGKGEKIGLKRCMNVAGDWSWSTVGGAYEATRATVAADADEIEKNTADFNGAMNGTNDFQAYFVQNFACFP